MGTFYSPTIYLLEQRHLKLQCAYEPPGVSEQADSHELDLEPEILHF